VAPKLVPAIVTVAPTAPNAGVSVLTAGPTVKTTPLLAMPETVTTTLPVVAAGGTTTTMLVALQVVITAAMPLKATELVLCAAPKPVPVMVRAEPTTPSGWLIEVMTAGTTKAETLLATPDTVTTIGPEVAPAGTAVTMDVLLQLVTAAVAPLNVTVLLPCVAPKFAPVIVIAVPAAPEVWLAVVIVGAVELGVVDAELVQPAIPSETETRRSSIHIAIALIRNGLDRRAERCVEHVTEKLAGWAASRML
jgi:hypothetical protein